MKRLYPSLLVALASTAIIGAAPLAAPAAKVVPAVTAQSAPSPERLAAARTYLVQSDAGERMFLMMHNGVAAGASMQFARISDAKVRSKAEASLAAFQVRVDLKLRDAMPAMIEAYAQVYAREFTAGELDELRLFATSPTGRHYLAQSVSLISDPRIEAAQTVMMESLTPVMEDLEKEACGAKAAARVAAGDKHAKCPLSDG